MQIINKSVPLDSFIAINTVQTLDNFFSSFPFELSDVCFFDIETTGLSADVSSLYLIGAASVFNDELSICQWFADDYMSEAKILTSFAEYLSRFKAVVHYNGSGFDIPYLTKKYKFHQIPSPFEMESIDLYRQINPLRKFLPIPNLKLTTVEHFLHIQRNDSFTGKECIDLYVSFMKEKYFKNDFIMMQNKQDLLLHNHDDILGTFFSAQLLLYTRPPFEHAVNINFDEQDDILFIKIETTETFPVTFSYETENVRISFHENMVELKCSLYYGTLYYFYPDYKNYYYLPLEDVAMHKSVAQYVDSSLRKRATKANCYTKKEGIFLPLINTKLFTSNDVPLFFNQNKSSSYIEWNDELKKRLH